MLATEHHPRASAALASLVAKLGEGNEEAAREPGLYSGAAGRALVQYAVGDPAAARLWSRKATSLLSEVECGPHLVDGLAGVGWVLDLARTHQSKDPCVAVDEILLEFVLESEPDEGLELLSGLAGLAVYAAQRMPAPGAARLLTAIAARIEQRTETVEDGVIWDSAPRLTAARRASGVRQGDWDLGLAHGVAGPISALALAHAWGLGDHQALIDRALVPLLSRERPPERFPDSLDRGGECLRSRGCAWCYGGLGIGAWLVALGELLARPELEARGLAMALRHIEQHDDARVASLCHGRAGVVALLDTIAGRHEAARPFAERAATALLDALDRGDWGARQHGAPALSVDLLEGIPGATLALASQLAPERIPWRRLLLLDLRGPGRP